MFLVFIAVMVYFGLGIVLMFVAYRRMVKRGRSLAVRLGVVLLIGFIVWAIPYGDHTLGKLEFESLCKKEGGEHITRTATDVEGFMWSLFEQPAGNPRELGYQFVEGKVNQNGLTSRLSATPDSSYVMEKNVTPISRYVFNLSRTTENTQIERVTDTIVDRVTGEELAHRTEFLHRGGWLMRSLASMNAYSVVCPSRPKHESETILFIKKVLKAKVR